MSAGQASIGENFKMNLNGNLGFGYSGAFGDIGQSTHGQGFNGNLNLTGYYFHPNFLSFEFRPYYDRSQTNSDSQTITTGTGLGASASFLSGSHFPFAVSYGRELSSNSEFRVAGVPGLFGDGSGQTFAVSWSELLPNWPQLFANFNVSSASNSVVGLNGDSESSSKNLNLTSTYKLAGFNLQGNFNHQNNSFSSPVFLTTSNFSGSGSSTSYGISAQHKLPFSGTFGVGWNRGTYGNDASSQSTTDTANVAASITPWRPLSLNSSVTYTTNLTAALGQEIAGTGSAPLLLPDLDSRSLSFLSSATWSIGRGLVITGYFNHRTQSFQGSEYADSQYGGVLNYRYSHPLFGMLYFGFGTVDTANKFGNQGLGITANVGMNRKFGGWDTSADFSYAQNVQTYIALATTSSYSYGASVRRRLNRETFWSGYFRGMHSGISAIAGTSSRSENVATSIGWRRYSFSGTYAQSTGIAVLTASGGLTPTPLAGLITDDFLYFNARSYGVSASSHLLRPLSLSATYANVKSDTLAQTLSSFNNGQRYGARMEYRLRKFSIIGGFSRTEQEISASTQPKQVVNSYSLSLTRWFNLF